MSHTHPFRFGVICENMRSRQQWLDTARQVEDLGYNTLLIRDHFIQPPFGDQFAPIAALMTAAGVTTHLRIGTMVFDNDYRHPVILAKEAATLDLLSDGRFELGLGAGWMDTEYQQAGMSFDPPGVRISRFEEALHILKGLFSSEPLTFQGKHYSISQLKNYPESVQRPHPPIFIGAGGKRMLSIAAREANSIGILSSPLNSGSQVADPTAYTAANIAQKITCIQEAAGTRFNQIELSLVLTLIITEHRHQSAEYLLTSRGWQGVTVEDVLDMPSIFIGSIEQIIEQMHQRRERFGFSYYVIPDRDMQTLAPIVAHLRQHPTPQ